LAAGNMQMCKFTAAPQQMCLPFKILFPGLGALELSLSPMQGKAYPARNNVLEAVLFVW